ncbi:hypothetical protein INS49_009135 [Diaporthe citri]|uniref:uncharacterized protein n=1 Tax=Diaporthe citri TaxID=83186 RepID=UPI001C7EB78E|nr:uncharacterized protein INS49_009135 [Diaporthe citri]KAG6364032.1 hypothetical protein INS49_009135 [Diaporthe citri]
MSLSEVGLGRAAYWESLWAEAYRTIKNDPEYSHLLETFEKYLRNAEHENISTVSEGVERLEEIQKLAKTKLEKLPEARTAFSIGGRRIVVRELVQKAIRTVKAFKPIVSEAVSAEPHAALAWGCILTILPMLENLYQQDEHAANGLNNILFILVRYQQLQETVLSDEFEDPSQTEATRQLLSIIRSKLVSVYAQVYVYQIRFILQYGRIKWLRNVRNIVSADDWKGMWNDIESTSRLVDQGIQDRVGIRTSEAWKAINEIKARTEEIKGLQRSTLEMEFLLSLQFAGNATFDSAEVLGAEAPCLEGTQRRILSEIRDWAENPAGEVIFWLHGMAGTGKTSVALTVADALNQRKPFTKRTNAPATAFLGASFFFKQGDATRNSAKAFFPTLARCLADVFMDFRSLIASAINENLAIGTKAPPQQLEYLITRPLLPRWPNLPTHTTGGRGVQLRLLITSRTEKHILGSFGKLPKNLHRSVFLDKIKPYTEGQSTEDDIKFYLSHTIAEIAKKHGAAQDCIDEASINKLRMKADGLFIYAATACRFLDAEDFPDEKARQERLDQIFQDYSETDDSETDEWEADAPQQKVDEIYLKVLSFPDREQMSPKTRQRTYDGMRMTLGFLAALFEPVATSALENLLPPLPVSLAQLLKKLHAIVGVPRDDKSSLDLVHLSFRDFILSKKRSKQLKFRVDETEMHKELFSRCLEIMSSRLCRDICGLVIPGKMASEIPHIRIEENIPQHLRYACRYWVDHLAKLDNSHLREAGLMDGGKIHAFLQECFLYWLEAMSLIKEIPTAILIVNQLQTLVVDYITGTERFRFDERKWYLYAAFSPDGRSIALGSDDGLINVREFGTGNVIDLEGHNNRVSNVAFSPKSNKTLASASCDTTVRIWNIDERQTTHTAGFR